MITPFPSIPPRPVCLLLSLLGLTSVFPSAGAEPPATNAPAVSSPLALSVITPDHLADWQRRLTLGPGDVLDISLYGQTDSARLGLAIGPDGRLNYLNATDVLATGLTVDELRAELEKILSKFYLAPQVVIVPVAYHSKKYYLFGSVQGRGVHLLDRPLTLIEAIAKAHGFPQTSQGQNVASLVDFSRSFLVRRAADGSYGQVPVDFEALFSRGDLSQNIALAPDDHLFFPPLLTQEVYVLGEVRGQGLLPLTKDLTALGAVVARGGFTERAWKTRLLIVRGSLLKPETLVVDADAILRGLGKDVRLANRDIIYVHRKPWAKAEELLQTAMLQFCQAATMGFVNRNVTPNL